jgi:hypothetical protein
VTYLIDFLFKPSISLAQIACTVALTQVLLWVFA